MTLKCTVNAVDQHPAPGLKPAPEAEQNYHAVLTPVDNPHGGAIRLSAIHGTCSLKVGDTITLTIS